MGTVLILSWATMPLWLAHPIRPNVITGILTAIAAFFWFASGSLFVVWATWGA